MNDLARLRIWGDPAIRGALSWYLDVAENRRPAKFRIAATVATQLDLTASSEGALWAELDRHSVRSGKDGRSALTFACLQLDEPPAPGSYGPPFCTTRLLV
jgi:hypothetical protein